MRCVHPLSSLVLAVCVGLLLFSCEPEKGVVVSQNLEVATPEQMRLIGAALRDQLALLPDEFPLLDRSAYGEAYAYLDQLLHSAVQTPQYQYRNYYDWSLDLIRDDTLVHAFILPGGHLYLTTGLLRYLQDESEALALIAHELHYADTDAAFRHLREAVGGFTLGDIVLGNDTPDLPDAVRAAASISWSHADVQQADSVAVAAVCPFRYDATALARLVARMQADSQPPRWLQTHDSGEPQRVARLQEWAKPCGHNELTNAASWRHLVQDLIP
ncbi:MAG: hypothetical protein D6818_09415 [Bacteroidetes bacterium]|nr:MAG: hypothetical protein D6818_09415 [Bacteroidota bacterium]